MRSVNHPTAADLERARVAVQRTLPATPVLQIDAHRWLKLETQQPIGAFKVRGAIAAMSSLPSNARVVTASAGNHALGIAWAAGKLDMQATIVVAETVSPRKLELLRELGANVVLHGDDFDAAEEHALSLANDRTIYVSAYNDPHVIAGGGTVLDELLAQIDGDFTVIVPVGGGGLCAGIATRAGMEQDRRVRVIGVEAANSTAVTAAMPAGETVPVNVLPTLADGLAGNLEPGSITPGILHRHGVEMLTLTEAEIRTAMCELHERHDVTAEGAAAVAYAAMTRERIEGTVVAIISGRNVAESTFNAIVG